MDNKEDKPQNRKNDSRYMGIGIAIGVAIGVALDNIAVGIALGVVYGAVMTRKEQSRNENQTPSNNEDE